MKRAALTYAYVQLCLACLAPLVLAAPTPRFGPFDVEGTVSHVQWLPEKFVKAGPMMTGTAGHDRVFPAHFLVSLTAYSGIDAGTIREMKYVFPWSISAEQDSRGMPEFIILHLSHNDKAFMKEGMRIRVRGYVLWGDEGGAYPSYEEIQVLSGKE